MDDDQDPATPVNRMPSYTAMTDFAYRNDEVKKIQAAEKAAEIKAEFGNLEVSKKGEDTGENPNAWIERLERSYKGEILGTINNVLLILERDENLAGKFALNAFAGRGEVLGQKLPWSTKEEKRRPWSDTDTYGLYWYMEAAYQITKRMSVDAALDIHSSRHAFNDVQDYLEDLHWDGMKRLETLFVDYLGAEDSDYTREVTRKSFVAAVARAMTPGCKFDNMLILCGPQGIGKSTILDKMSRGFFNDSIRTFEGKEASELLQGVWLVEVAELDAFRLSDVSRIKQFLSLREDRYRAAYGRHVKEFPRTCVFFGTCNNYDILRDTTGNRRFWPVDVGRKEPNKNVFEDLTKDVIDQVWAEAMARWKVGETVYLSDDISKKALEVQENHRNVDELEGVIGAFLEKQIPANWSDWPLDKRLIFWSGGSSGDIKLVDRTRVCVAEIWCELLRKPLPVDKGLSRKISDILSRIDGWKRHEYVLYMGGGYSRQRAFVRETQSQQSFVASDDKE